MICHLLLLLFFLHIHHFGSNRAHSSGVSFFFTDWFCDVFTITLPPFKIENIKSKSTIFNILYYRAKYRGKQCYTKNLPEFLSNHSCNFFLLMTILLLNLMQGKSGYFINSLIKFLLMPSMLAASLTFKPIFH